MGKDELVKNLQKSLEEKGLKLSQAESKLVWDTSFECLADCVSKGNKVVIKNFGSFESKLQSYRDQSEFLKSGKHQMLQRFKVLFKASEIIKTKLNAGIKK